MSVHICFYFRETLVHHCINYWVISTCYPCHLHAFEPRCSPLHRRFVDAQLTRISSTITSRLMQWCTRNLFFGVLGSRGACCEGGEGSCSLSKSEQIRISGNYLSMERCSSPLRFTMIKRGMTTSSTAIFVPFMTQELRMDGEAVYYGLNALSYNVIISHQ